MGAYYLWINVTKQQKLENVFNNGFKLWDNCRYDCPQTNALLTLLASDWFGDLVVFVADVGISFSDWPDTEQDGRFSNLPCWPDYEYANEYYEDITGMFKCAEGETWLDYNPDGCSVERPYLGPFDKDIVQFRYVINESKHEWIDRKTSFDDRFGPDFDPSAILLADSLRQLQSNGKLLGFDGIWIGDVIRPSHEPPGEGFTDMTNRYRLWR